MRNKILYLICFIFLLIIYIPRIPIASIPGISSVYRIDTFFTFIFSFFSFIYCLLYKKNKYFYLFILYFLIFLFSHSMGFLIYLSSFLLYFSFFSLIIILEDVFKIIPLVRILNFFRFYLFLNIFIHFFSMIFQFNISISNTEFNDGILIGLFGLLFAPYNFIILLVTGGFLEYFIIKKIYSFRFICILLALIFADSRAGLGFFLVILGFDLIFFNKGSKNIAILLIISTFSFLFFSSLESLNIKSLLIFSDFNVNEDPSLLMRFDNFSKWLDWVTLFKLLFGGGAQIFVTFVLQYGLPGPFDNFYLRLISEVGLFGFILFIYLMFIQNNFNLRKKYFIYAFFWFFFFSFFNESFLAIKGGHIFWLFISILKSEEFDFFLKKNFNLN